MTTGEGGIVITAEPRHARRMRLFSDRGWGHGDADPDHDFLALNYRMNEPTGAVAVAQLAKLPSVVERRRAAAERLTQAIADLPGITPQSFPDDSTPVYWKYCVNVDEEKAGATLDEITAHMREGGIFAAPRYVGKPAFECQVFRDKVTFGKSSWPYTDPSRKGLPEVDHDRANFPGSIKALSQILVIPWNEHYTDEHVDHIAACLHSAVKGV